MDIRFEDMALEGWEGEAEGVVWFALLEAMARTWEVTLLYDYDMQCHGMVELPKAEETREETVI